MIVARPAAASASAFTLLRAVLTSITPSFTRYHTGVASGGPSPRSTASTPTRASARNASRSDTVIDTLFIGPA